MFESTVRATTVKHVASNIAQQIVVLDALKATEKRLTFLLSSSPDTDDDPDFVALKMARRALAKLKR